MIKRHKGTLLLTSLIILIPILAGLFLWNKLPEQMPIHWNMAGEVDNHCSKSFAVFAMPVIMLALQWLCTLLTGLDPKHTAHNEKYFRFILWIIPTLSILLGIVVYSAALGQDVKVEKIVPVFLGLLFALTGNTMPKFSQNYTIGIKLPWTLNSKENWNKTHRLAGKLWMVGGILTILFSFVGTPLLLFPVVILMVLIPVIYSYTLYRKESQAK